MKLSVLEEFLNGAFWRIQEKPIFPYRLNIRKNLKKLPPLYGTAVLTNNDYFSKIMKLLYSVYKQKPKIFVSNRGFDMGCYWLWKRYLCRLTTKMTMFEKTKRGDLREDGK